MRYIAVLFLVLTSSARATEPACVGEQGQIFYDPDFCKAIQNSKEALEMNRKLLEKSEEIRQKIELQLKKQLEEIGKPHAKEK